MSSCMRDRQTLSMVNFFLPQITLFKEINKDIPFAIHSNGHIYERLLYEWEQRRVGLFWDVVVDMTCQNFQASAVGMRAYHPISLV